MISPEERARWAKRCDELVRPSGELVTLIYPVPPALAVAAEAVARNDGGSGGAGGAVAAAVAADPTDEPDTCAGAGGAPPFTISPRLVERLLAPTGFECTLLELVPEARRARAGMGAEFIARWRKQGGS